MTVPVAGPADRDSVKLLLRIGGTSDDAVIDQVVAAVNSMVRDLPVATPDSGATWATWPDRVVLGAVMLSARLFRRRDTPSGVQTFGDYGPVYVQRNDPDVAQLLQLGAYKRPAVG